MVCLNRVDLEGGEVGDQQATKLAADMVTPKGPCLFLSVSLSSGELRFPPREINAKPDPFPCTLCIRLPGIPVCQGPSQSRAAVLEQLLTALPFSLKSVPLEMAQHTLALSLEPLLFTRPPAASLGFVPTATLLVLLSPAASARDVGVGEPHRSREAPPQNRARLAKGPLPLAHSAPVPPHCPACAGRDFLLGQFARSQASSVG